LGEKGEDLASEWITEMADVTVSDVLSEVPPREWDWDELIRQLTVLYPTELDRADLDEGGGLAVSDVADAAVEEAHAVYARREQELGADTLRKIEKTVVLSVIDNKWREHLSEMDYMRAGIGLRAMGQRDPLVEYQREGYDLFADLVDSVKRDSVRYLFHVQVAQEAEKAKQEQLRFQAQAAAAGGGQARQAVSDKVGRNDPCPCGSGKKYKKCHGAVA
jgi:preprotein translocase subunit SecA